MNISRLRYVAHSKKAARTFTGTGSTNHKYKYN